MKRFLRMALTALTLGSAGGAHAIPAVYAPQAAPVGGAEFYVATPLKTNSTTPPAIAEEALKDLLTRLPEARAITVKYAQNTVDLTIDPASLNDPAVVDRALGAVFFTLRSIGFSDVRVDGVPLSATGFSRATMAVVWPVVALFGGERPRDGFVNLETEIVPVATFFARLDSQDKNLQAWLRKTITDGRAEVRLGLVTHIDALKLKDKESILIGRLSDGDVRVRRAAVAGFGKSPSANAQKALASYVETETVNTARLEAVRVLVGAGRNEFARYLLLEKLQGTDVAEVTKAARELAATKDVRFASGFAGLMSHADASVRALGVELLGGLEQWGVLAQALAEETIPVPTREGAAKLVVQKAQGEPRVKALIWLVASGPEASAVEAAGQIAAGPVTGTTDGLRKALARSERPVREAAAKAAAAIKDPAALEALAGAQRSATEPAEKTAYDAAATAIIGAQSIDQALAIARSKDDTIRELATRALVAFAGDTKPNPKIVDALRAALGDAQLPIRRAAAEALARIADDGIAGELLKLKGDADAGIRAAVVAGVARSKLGTADAAILEAIDDNDPLVKEAALIAMRDRRIEAGLEKARWLVSHRKPEVRRAAMAALVAVAKPAAAQLFELYSKAMNDEDEIFRLHALDGLKTYPVSDARVPTAIGTPLIDERAPKSLQLKALEILVGMGGPDVVEHAVRGLFIEVSEVKMATLDAIEKLKSDKAVRPLQEFILREQDPAIRARAEQVREAL